MKGIFISQAVSNKNNGGGQFVRSLIQLIGKCIGEDNLTIVSLPNQFFGNKQKLDYKHVIEFDYQPNKLQRIANFLSGNPKYVNKDIFNQIASYVKKQQFDFVFLGFSTYSYLIKKIKKETNLPVFVMYQGIAPNTAKSKVVNASIIKKISIMPSYYMVSKRERVNSNLADCNIVHNTRERNVYFSYYKKNPQMMLPVFLKDRFQESRIDDQINDIFSLLFVGSFFGPNISGLKWFIKNVMRKMPNNIVLYVVGQGMDKLNNDKNFIANNVKIIGEVEDLDGWYYKSNLVVEPIFEGDGMKTKTVEAMMFGKTILGTKEAFEGYDGFDNYLCNTSDDFINLICYHKEKSKTKYNDDIRKIYLEKYSEEAAYKIMMEGLNNYVRNK